MIKITHEGKILEYQEPPVLKDVAKDLGINSALAVTVNLRLRELSYILTQDAEIKFLTTTNSDAIKIYEATLRYVIAKAIHTLHPKQKIKFSYTVSRAILAVFDDQNFILNEEIMKSINDEVDRIIKADMPITRRRISVGEATKLYKELNMLDKVEILKYRHEDYVNLYECDSYMNYMFGYMLPSTGYLKDYKMFLYHPGFVIQYPRAEFDGKIPAFKDEPTFGKALKEVTKWGRITNGNTIPRINQYASNPKSSVDFVNMCETKHNHQLYELGEIIQNNIEDIRLIMIAGPSSSGKTTFSNRLRIELKTRNIHPIMISMDDYYLPKSEAPKDEFGNPDLEHVNALDVKQFNQDMLALIRGEEVTLPHFNFKIGKREPGKTIKVDKNHPIIIEGIHALNDALTKSIPKHQKFKIYIAPQTQLHIDDHNPISITDLRLLRRIVRDQKYRNSSAEDTMDMWPSVRRGEFKWIYPHQNDANYVFNSELTYEFAVLKPHAVRQLQAILPESKHYITANKLLKFLKYFESIDESLIPCNSLLREFIGGSSFN